MQKGLGVLMVRLCNSTDVGPRQAALRTVIIDIVKTNYRQIREVAQPAVCLCAAVRAKKRCDFTDLSD